MLNLNQIETGSEQKPLELIPDKTPVRAIINLLGGDAEMPEFAQGFFIQEVYVLKRGVLPYGVHHYWW